ncbi:polyisoprenoid-binding protein YceI [Paraperlucidibaca baekdonensis]|uniref:Polyisoprenoid-binding protein YceI n=1 Tax=Paraperlucidibaca baekdonensis TaxID=748120 RepID=A0A3E0H8S6_9GAMM|nr:YceI family protein [Paraperlucidibaca baekdonensis]REH40121.1 polyisoprenoid-binding protein YceI [Paraperlucidibaca baekdonensis]
MALLFVAPKSYADRIITYAIDSKRTEVSISWHYLGVPTEGGAFSGVTGFIYGNLDHPEKSWAEARIPVKTFDSGWSIINHRLVKSGDFFQTKQYPEIIFRSHSIDTVNKKSRELSLSGELSVNGIVRPMTLFAETAAVGPHPFYGDANAASLRAVTRFRRSEFGMDKFMGMVSDEIVVNLTVEALVVKN